ncbi:MAG: 1-(5-phosphoribosyl)-5-[(5-phosphoribosylamino)methylideneamino]imidazole-4-carboxamide isomerase [Rickettsiales bacterium]|nr:1-(5-phosphoribosyl)-5-[(5-phosphoribosylamino)methylideneamino]imidazole-4-carboxamide isomerase [Rickettsiales bacterium]
MIIYPAIDLSKGYIVRLLKGNFDKKKIYTKNILNQAKLFEDKGTTWIHVVDLDGALEGENKNQTSILEIINNTNCKIQLGGGIRSLQDIERWLKLGVNRVVIGTAAILEDDLVKNAVKNFPNTVSVGLDLYKDSVAIKGWTEKVKEKKADYFFKKFSDLEVESIIYTDIDNDGVLKGPNYKEILRYKSMIDVPLIASGGVASLEDIKKLYSNKIYGVIVGKAIYDNKINLNELFYYNKLC